MFSQLSGWMQYLYVILFMMICGYGVPYLGGFNSEWSERKETKFMPSVLKGRHSFWIKARTLTLPTSRW